MALDKAFDNQLAAIIEATVDTKIKGLKLLISHTVHDCINHKWQELSQALTEEGNMWDMEEITTMLSHLCYAG